MIPTAGHREKRPPGKRLGAFCVKIYWLSTLSVASVSNCLRYRSA